MRATELNRNTPFFPKKQPLDGWSKLGIDLFLLNPNPWHLYLDMDMDFIHRAIERLRADVEEQRVN